MSNEAKQAAARRLRERRLELKLTQDSLAKLVGVTQPSLHEWETGEFQPTFANRIRLAAVLGEDPYAIEVAAAAEGAA